MKKLYFSMLLTLLMVCHFSIIAQDSTAVEKWGQLRVEGTNIVDQYGNPVALRGMSLFWSQWIGKYYNEECIEWLKDDWQCTVVRAAMAAGSGGYLENPETEFAKIETVIDACLDLGIYVIVDWHDHEAENHVEAAIEFFTQIAQNYGDEPNLIYEIYNEPLQVSWVNVVKPYADTLVTEIRAIDPDNIIIVGTPTWSQDVDAASRNPVEDDNVAYAIHFYSGTHTQWLRNKCVTAMNNGAALFVSEWGTCESNGNGDIFYDETEKWFDFMDEHMLSWCNWSIADKDESSAALMPGASATGGWSDADLSESGAYVRGAIISWSEYGTGVVTQDVISSSQFSMVQNYPNPFNQQSVIRYQLSTGGMVQVKVFDIRGLEVVTLLDEKQEAGSHQIRFDGTHLASGIYVVQLNVGEHVVRHKMMLMK
ncbi:cellulase family glycosylhydrolase [bacterium]